MKPILDDRFYELAFKSMLDRCTPEEDAELRLAVANEPARAQELQEMKAHSYSAKELIALLGALEAKGGSPSAEARQRIRRKVAKVFGLQTGGDAKTGKTPNVIDIEPVEPEKPPDPPPAPVTSALPTPLTAPPGIVRIAPGPDPTRVGLIFLAIGLILGGLVVYLAMRR